MAKNAADTPTKPSTRDRLKAAKLPERTVDLCLRGDLQAEFEDLERQLAQQVAADQAAGPRLNSSPAARRIAKQIEDLRERMREETIILRMRALTRRAWGELQKQHPPRKDEADDEQLGFNPDTFIPAAIKACTYEPSDLDDETWDELLDERITEQQFVALQNTMMALNVRPVSVPNSYAASRLLQGSEPG
jgi:hypothetical protein